MKATELRIGNYVKENKSIIKVWLLAYTSVNGRTYEEKGFPFKPIPLTEEWLFRFGFKKLDKYSYNHKGWFIHFRVKKGGFIYSEKTKVEYLHQLQNLYFALTQKELELKNPIT